MMVRKPTPCWMVWTLAARITGLAGEVVWVVSVPKLGYFGPFVGPLIWGILRVLDLG